MERFSLDRAPQDMRPRYNIAPTQSVPVIFDDDENALLQAKWGIKSKWSDHPLFNARAESIDKKPSFKEDFEERRCLILADSFYEWKQPEKRPYRVFLKSNDMFAFAGIYQVEEQRTCCMVTVDANPLISKIHDRMPAILPIRKEKEFLGLAPEEAKEMLIPFPAKLMDMYEVSPDVNSARNDSPKLWDKKKSLFDY
jgi:putative SOS response-associated peptidase YedK